MSAIEKKLIEAAIYGIKMIGTIAKKYGVDANTAKGALGVIEAIAKSIQDGLAESITPEEVRKQIDASGKRLAASLVANDQAARDALEKKFVPKKPPLGKK